MIKVNVISFIGFLILSIIHKTLRIKAVNAVDLRMDNSLKKAIYAFWHGEQFVLLRHHRNQGVVIMSSLSKDGEIQAGILERFGYNVVRGSSSRGGERALVKMIKSVREGCSAAFAVDGPKGPAKEIKPGVLYLAKKTGLAIIPVGSASTKYKVLYRAWDKYELPLPFSKSIVVYGDPVIVNDDSNIEKKAAELKSSLDNTSSFAHTSYWTKDIKEYLSNHPKPRIIIIQPSRIGDVIFALPSVIAIKKTYPHAHISWFVDERCSPILKGNKYLDEIVVIDRSKMSLSYICRIKRELNKKNIDLSIDFHGLAKSAFMVWLAGARFKLASSSTNGMRELSYLVSKEVPPASEDTHCVDRHLAVAKYLGYSGEFPGYGIFLGEKERASMNSICKKAGLNLSKPFVLFHPGGGWISRRWNEKRYSELTNLLVSKKGIQAVYIGGKEGGAKEGSLNKNIIIESGVKCYDFTGLLTLKELGVLMKKCILYIGNEAGPMHLAVALDTEVIALLGPTDPNRTGPYRGKTHIIRHTVECQPCRNRNCSNKECMDLISVGEVYDKACEILKV